MIRNFVVGITGKSFSMGELAGAGVRQISLATSLYRAAMTGFLDACQRGERQGQVQFHRPVRDDG
jgi:2-methylisocitrate lyase-like PEP mutase family enzyme